MGSMVQNKVARFLWLTMCIYIYLVRLVLPSNFGSSKDILTIFGTEISKTMPNMIIF